MKRVKLVPESREWYRLASVWVILLLVGLSSINGFIDEIRAHFGLNLWQTMALTVATAAAGMASRLCAFAWERHYFKQDKSDAEEADE